MHIHLRGKGSPESVKVIDIFPCIYIEDYLQDLKNRKEPLLEPVFEGKEK